MSTYVQIDPEQIKLLAAAQQKPTVAPVAIKSSNVVPILVIGQIMTMALVLFLFFSGNGARRDDPVNPIVPVLKVEDVAEQSLRSYITKKSEITRQFGQMIADGKITSKSQLVEVARPAQTDIYKEANRQLDVLDEATMPPVRDAQGNIVGDYNIPENKEKIKDYFFRKADGYDRLLKGK